MGTYPFDIDSLFALVGQLLAGLRGVVFSVQLGDVDGGATGAGGAVGHLIAAAMETAGVFAQAEVLQTFRGGLENLAALCYACAIAGGLLTDALFGQYRQALYFLIGPPLFFFVISTTQNVNGVEVKNGDRVTPGSIEDQIRFLDRYVNDAQFDQGAEVSFLFYGIDRVVSSVVQGIVSVIIDTKNKDDLLYKTRERVLSWTLLSSPPSAGFNKIVALATAGECAEVSHRTFEMLKHRIDSTKRSIDDDNLDDIGKNLKRLYDEEKTRPRFLLDHETATYLSDDPKTQAEYEQYPVSCEQMWTYLHAVAINHAEDRLDINSYIGSGDKDPNIPWDRVEADVREALGGEAAAREVLAAYMVKNAMARTSHANFIGDSFNRVQFNAERSAGVFEDSVEIHRFGGHLKVQFFARSIPYIQGLLLYILAASFPFFAVFLVMPSRASTFLVWLSLWIWVKSWDIGFALVDVARGILWMFTRGSVDRFAPGTAPNANMVSTPLDWTRPETLFAFIADNDPLANQNTYFTIVAILILAVPLLTAHFCLGAGTLWGVFSANISQKGDYNQMRRTRQLGRHPASVAERAKDELPALGARDHAMQTGRQIRASKGGGTSGGSGPGGAPGQSRLPRPANSGK